MRDGNVQVAVLDQGAPGFEKRIREYAALGAHLVPNSDVLVIESIGGDIRDAQKIVAEELGDTVAKSWAGLPRLRPGAMDSIVNAEGRIVPFVEEVRERFRTTTTVTGGETRRLKGGPKIATSAGPEFTAHEYGHGIAVGEPSEQRARADTISGLVGNHGIGHEVGAQLFAARFPSASTKPYEAETRPAEQTMTRAAADYRSQTGGRYISRDVLSYVLGALPEAEEALHKYLRQRQGAP